MLSHEMLMSMKKCCPIFHKSFILPKLPIYFIFKHDRTTSLSPLGSCHEIDPLQLLQLLGQLVICFALQQRVSASAGFLHHQVGRCETLHKFQFILVSSSLYLRVPACSYSTHFVLVFPSIFLCCGLQAPVSGLKTAALKMLVNELPQPSKFKSL